MSTYYDLHCVTCDKRAYLHTRDTEALSGIAQHIQAFVPLASLNLDIKISLGDYCDEGSLYMEWIRDHGMHQIRVRNEYGQYKGDCNQYVEQGHYYCTLRENHDGEHGPFLIRGDK